MNFMMATLDGDNLKLPIADARFKRPLREGANPADGQQLIAGIRPENFEDAEVVPAEARDRGCTFRAHIEVVESMGSELYAHFTVEGAEVDSAELRELAADAGAGELPSSEAGRITARLAPESQVREGAEAELWLDTPTIHLFDPQSGMRLTD
jgi:multiple sugar transport system ATP-binding protein